MNKVDFAYDSPNGNIIGAVKIPMSLFYNGRQQGGTEYHSDEKDGILSLTAKKNILDEEFREISFLKNEEWIQGEWEIRCKF